jgi:NADH dehydrogenase FAD-containing subunit
VANQKAKYAARRLNALVREREVKDPFVFRNQGSLAYIGDWSVFFSFLSFSPTTAHSRASQESHLRSLFRRVRSKDERVWARRVALVAIGVFHDDA